MSIRVMSAVLENGPDNSTERFVLLVLANYVDANGKCWPAYSTIARQTALSRSTVIRAVKSLVEQGYLRVQTRRPHGESISNYFWINFSKLGVTYDQDPDDPDISGSSTALPPSSTALPPSSTALPPSSTVTPGGSSTVTPPSSTVTPDPLLIRNSSDPSVTRQQQQRGRDKRPAAAASESSPAMAVLQEYGVALNKTTTPLLNLDADYVRAHLDHARRNNVALGLVIRRMLDGDPAPNRPERSQLYDELLREQNERYEHQAIPENAQRLFEQILAAQAQQNVE